MNNLRIRRLLTISVAAAVLLAFGATDADARHPEKVFRGQILTGKKPFPTSAKSKNAYIRKLKKNKTKRFLENKKKKSWKIYYAAFFRSPLNDLELTVKLYDVTNGRKKLINSYEQYTDRRGMRSLLSYITLERKFFGVNKQILMIMENRGRILATGRFSIVGEAEKYSGEVTFTEEETKGN